MTNEEIIERLEKLPRYDSQIDYGCCEECSPSACMEPDDTGSYVSRYDVEKLIAELKYGH